MKTAEINNKLKALCTKLISLCKSDAGVKIIDFVFSVLFYGFALNFIAVSFLKFYTINVYSTVSFGLVFYFIKEEIPNIIRRTIK